MRIIFCIFITVLVCSFSCCNSIQNERLVSNVNNNQSIVSNTLYTDSDLEHIIQFKGSYAELDKIYPIEYEHISMGVQRVVYYGQSSIAIVMFTSDQICISGRLVQNLKPKSVFNQLEIGRSLETVRAIDRDGEFLFLYTGRNDLPRISTHYTSDGYVITVAYTDDNIIEGIQVDALERMGDSSRP